MAAALRAQAATLSGVAGHSAAARGRSSAAALPIGRRSPAGFSALRTAPQHRVSALSARTPVTAAAAAAEVDTPPSLAANVSENYAVVEIGGTQMLVEEGRWYSCDRLEAEPGSKIQLGRVIAHKAKDSFTVGKPYLENVTVEAEVLEELRGPKVLVYKMKSKKHYRRMKGHRQELTKFKVTKISA
mmetsp:Transcript_32861/g.93238  ORF Transcript_32861/g.93238 Transcript_32861/m.93238 type:complete len:186 (-) Transcript_32861:270-827(-)